MSSGPESFIPIIAIAGGLSIPIFWFFFESKNKASRDRMVEKALESGAPLEEVRDLLTEDGAKTKDIRKMPFRKGLILMALGAGLLMSRELEFFGPSGTEESGMAGVFGLCGLLLGAALFTSDIFNRKRF